ncbi:uncharacterized protein WCC33_017807 [Rhinophrynus dorsalis]
MEMVREGYVLEFQTAPPNPRFKTSQVRNKGKILQMRQVLQSLLLNKVIEEVPVSQKFQGFYSILFSVLKPSGKLRLILDLKDLNQSLRVQHFKMESVLSAIKLTQPQNFLSRIDLKDAFYHVLIRPSHRKYLRFHILKTHYQFRALPFGLATAPQIFTKLLAVAMAELRSQYQLKVVPYLDDILLISPSLHTAVQNTAICKRRLQELGWLINEEKSMLYPSKQLQFLGVIIDTALNKVTLSLDRQDRILQQVTTFLSRRLQTVKLFSKILGHLSSAQQIIPWARSHTRQMQYNFLQFYRKDPANWYRRIPILTATRKELAWWIRKKNLTQGRPLTEPPKQILTTDASCQGWGGVWNQKSVQGVWSDQEQKLHINSLELLAIWKSLLHFQKELASQAVLIRSDNVSAVQYLQNQGGTRSIQLNRLAVRILSWAEKHLLALTASHLSGHLNIQADFLSRKKLHPGEWSLNRKVFLSLIQTLGSPTVDLMATAQNRQCPKYLSRGNKESKNGQSECHSNSSKLAKKDMVCRPHTDVSLPSNSSAGHSGSTMSRANSTPQSVLLPTQGLEAERESLALQGLSESVINTILQGRRPSTTKIYYRVWTTFHRWCISKKLKRQSIAAPQILEFLQTGFQKGLKPASLKVQLSALSAILATPFADNFLIKKYMTAICKIKPTIRDTVPSWDLNLVLQQLSSHPYFEPLESISIKHLTLKTVLLTAVTSARRVSELQALMATSPCLIFHQDKVVLKPNPAFRSKVISHFHLNQEIVLPSFCPDPKGDLEKRLHNLDLVRCLQIYIKRTQLIRKTDSLFVHHFGKFKGCAASKSSISRWIKNCIILSYESADKEPPLKIKAHSTRAISTSWAQKAEASPEEISLVLVFSVQGEDELIVETKQGRIKGFHLPMPSGFVTAYLGIPYGEAPIGTQRFKKPQPRKPWSGIHDASKFGKSCHQTRDEAYAKFHGTNMWQVNNEMSEDCLYLNVWVPPSKPKSTHVMVFIYGGAFLAGTSSLDIYDPSMLSFSEDVIVVSMNYRVGALGFLALPGNKHAPGNAGLFDQRLALKWVHENIAAFGGNPNTVTLFGHSSGAACVGFHLLSAGSQNYFSRVIIQSGSVSAPWAINSHRRARRLTLKLAEILGCSLNDDDTIMDCLQTVDPKDIVKKQILAETEHLYALTRIIPIVDNDFLNDIPNNLIKQHVKKIDVLIGGSKDDGNPFPIWGAPGFSREHESLISTEELVKGLMRYFPSVGNLGVESILFEYKDWEDENSKEKNREAMELILRDYYMICPMKYFADKVLKHKAKVFFYEFDHRSSQEVWPDWMGVLHGAILPFMFGKPLIEASNFTESEKVLSRKIMKFWANFARYGTPRGDDGDDFNWPLYTMKDQTYAVLKTGSWELHNKLNARRCHFWNSYLLKLVRKLGIMFRNKWLKILNVYIIVISVLIMNMNAEDDTVVSTKQGKVSGIKLFVLSGTITAYLGIPYGEPPTGTRRFQKPEPRKQWQGIHKAEKFGNSCYQNQLDEYMDFPGIEMWIVKNEMSEDCLYLNVWVPSSKQHPASVMVFIYGGGFSSGTTSFVPYDGSILAYVEDVIVVTINYRVGSFGFLAFPESKDAPGNAGLFDQRLALQWVHENIAAFGGNPDSVTIFGNSAGAASVAFHVISSASHSYFTRAIIQSGTATANWAVNSHERARRLTQKLAKNLECPLKETDAMLTCLKNADPKEMTEKQLSVESGYAVTHFVPVLDGDFIRENLGNQINETLKKADIIIGITKDDGNPFGVSCTPGFSFQNESLITTEDLKEGIRRFFPTAGDLGVESILLQYKDWEDVDNLEKNRKAMELIIRDYMFTCPTKKFANYLADHQINVFLYEYDHRSSIEMWPEWMGSLHAAELPIVFGKPLIDSENFTKAEYLLSKRIMKLWGNFAKTGSPNGDLNEDSVCPAYSSKDVCFPDCNSGEEFIWPTYSSKEEKYALFRLHCSEVKQKLSSRHCQFWNSYFPNLLKMLGNQ